jgi:predicted permease
MPDWFQYVRQHLSLPHCRPEAKAEIVEELAEQLEEAYQEALQSGLSEQEALLAAKRHVNDWQALANDLLHTGITQARKARPNVSDQPVPLATNRQPSPPGLDGPIRESSISLRSVGTRVAATLDAARQDLHYAARLLAKKPLFTLAAILTLAIGIGATTAIFSVVNAVLLRPLPYPKSNQLTVVWSVFGNEGRAPSAGPELISLRERSRLFDQFAGIWVQSGALTGKGEPEQIKLGWVSSNFLSLLSSSPRVGRFFVPEEEGGTATPAIVISYELWKRRYGADPKIVGQQVLLSGMSCTLVGVLPAGFKLIFPEGASVPPNIDVYVPFQWKLAKQPRDRGYVRIIGRMRDGVTTQQGQAELDNIAGQLRSEFHEYLEQNLRLQVLSLQGDVAHNVRPALLALFAGTGFVLLIACANVAMLVLSRANERRSEITVRAALGAEPARIVRQLLTESLLLSCLGGAAAFVVSWGILKLLWALQPAGIARMAPTGLDLTVLGFNLIVSVFCGILFGFSPALAARGVNLVSALREVSGTATEDKHLSRQLLIGCEVALTFVLLTSAALLVRTFIDLLRVEPGFDPRNVLTFQISLPDVRYWTPELKINFLREAQRRLSTVPAVQSVGVVSHLPFDDNLPNWYSYFWRDGASQQEQNTLMADHRSVLPSFFDSLSITFIAGRNFDTSDEISNRKAVIIDDALASQLWPDGGALGKKLNVENGHFVRDVAEVIGVVKHVQYHSLTNQVRPQLYLPYPLAVRPNVFFTVRSNSSPQLLIPSIRREIKNLDKDLPLAHVRPMDDYIADARIGTRFITVLCGSLAAIAFLLSCIGIYGVTSSTVAKRTKEIGVRMALGAQPKTIMVMVLRGSMTPVILGGLLGLALSLGLTPLLSGLLFGIRAIDPIVLISVFAFLCLVGLLASSLPAQCVIRGNPIAALRCE